MCGSHCTSGAEEEDPWSFQMIVEFVCDGDLCVSKGWEQLVISWTHVRVNVVKEDSE